jgi:hypothetical protein
VRAFAAILLLGSGCFYSDRINQRPSADIIQSGNGPFARGTTVHLHAQTNDPDGDPVFVSWRVYACTDATAPAGCDPDPYFMSAKVDVDVPVPSARANSMPEQALRVILEATDSLGATAQPSQELLLDVGDSPPSLTVSSYARYHDPDPANIKEPVVGTPVELDAWASDPDPGDMVTVDFQVVQMPAGATFTLADLTVMGAGQHAKTLVPSATGPWTVQVTATDLLQHQNTMPISLTVVDDGPPCLNSWSPVAPAMGQTLPLHDATLFQVLDVQDDLDPYPPVLGDALRGTTKFSWSLLPPGATSRVPMSVIGNSVALDPAAYTPGDVLELRVEIADRNATPITCADSAPTCSAKSNNCIQRLTWRIEVQ